MKLYIRSLKKAFNNKLVLDICELELESGKIYAIIGPNGSGKTTMLKLISNIEEADHKEISYDGSFKYPQGDIAYLAQKPYLFDMTVLKNIILGIEDRKNSCAEASNALDRIGMGHFTNRRARCLSGGEAQKIALARTLILGKKLILLDEPVAAVDISSFKCVEDYIRYINEKDKATIILTTHNPSQAVRLAHEVIVLWEGKVIEKGTPSKVFSSPKTYETREFIKNWRL